MPLTSSGRSLGTLLLAGLLFISPLHSEPGSVITAGGKLKSTVFNWSDLAPQATAVGERRDIADLPTTTFERLEAYVVSLSPGKRSSPPRKHPAEEIVVVKEGRLEVTLNGQKRRLSAGSVGFFAANDVYELRNLGEASAGYYVFTITTAATHLAPGEGASKQIIAGRTGSALFDWDKLVVEATETGQRRGVLNSPTATFANLDIHVITLNPGQVPNSRWTHPDEEVLVVKEGEMEVTIGSDSRRVGVGSVCFFAANEQHGWMNVGKGDATYYVIRVVTGPTAVSR